MFNIMKSRFTHSGRLERWLGPEQVEMLSQQTKHWYGSPIPVANVPGRVFAVKGGEFVGSINGGYASDLLTLYTDRLKKKVNRVALKQLSQVNTGFTSLSDLISEATSGGKRQQLIFSKAGAASIAGTSNSLWQVGASPAASTSPAAASAAKLEKNTATYGVGAIRFNNPGGSDTLHLVSAVVTASVAGQLLLLYDRLWHFNSGANCCNATNSITPSQASLADRYVASAAEAASNFISCEITTTFTGGVPTTTSMVVKYKDQDNNTAENSSDTWVNSLALTQLVVRRVPIYVGKVLAQPTWFVPLNAVDYGCRTVTSVDWTSSGGTAYTAGAMDWFMGHPLAFFPCPLAGIPVMVDGINSAFNLVEIKANAALAFLELAKAATTATNYNGMIILVSG